MWLMAAFTPSIPKNSQKITLPNKLPGTDFWLGPTGVPSSKKLYLACPPYRAPEPTRPPTRKRKMQIDDLAEELSELEKNLGNRMVILCFIVLLVCHD